MAGCGLYRFLRISLLSLYSLVIFSPKTLFCVDNNVPRRCSYISTIRISKTLFRPIVWRSCVAETTSEFLHGNCFLVVKMPLPVCRREALMQLHVRRSSWSAG